MYLRDYIDPAELAVALADGYITVRDHQTEPLVIFNYTAKAQYDGYWVDATMKCRGLIVDAKTDKIVARPFTKFFNAEQEPALMMRDEPIRVQAKMDGSLGILYREPESGEYSIATRGSFHSEQATWATNWFRKYADYSFFCDHNTYLFEILVDWNRIVVKYDWEGLVLLDVLNTYSGRSVDLPKSGREMQTRTPRDDGGKHLYTA